MDWFLLFLAFFLMDALITMGAVALVWRRINDAEDRIIDRTTTLLRGAPRGRRARVD